MKRIKFQWKLGGIGLSLALSAASVGRLMADPLTSFCFEARLSTQVGAGKMAVAPRAPRNSEDVIQWLQEPNAASWLQRVGCVSGLTEVACDVAIPLQLNSCYLPCSADPSSSVEIPLPGGGGSCAVRILDGAQFSPDERDDASGVSRRALPNGFLIKTPGSSVRVVPDIPADKAKRPFVSLAIFLPDAKNPRNNIWFLFRAALLSAEETGAVRAIAESRDNDKMAWCQTLLRQRPLSDKVNGLMPSLAALDEPDEPARSLLEQFCLAASAKASLSIKDEIVPYKTYMDVVRLEKQTKQAEEERKSAKGVAGNEEKVYKRRLKELREVRIAQAVWSAMGLPSGPLCQLLHQGGCLSENKAKSKKFTTPIHLHRICLPYPGNPPPAVVVSLPVEGVQCFVQIIEGAVFSQNKHGRDLGGNDVALRALVGVSEQLLKAKPGEAALLPVKGLIRKDTVGIYPNLENPSERTVVQLAVFVPGKSGPLRGWHIVNITFFTPDETKVLQVCLERYEDLGKQCHEAIAAGKVPNFEAIRKELKDVKRDPDFVVRLSDSGCPRWKAFLDELKGLNGQDLSPENLDKLVNELAGLESTAAYLFGLNTELGRKSRWYDPCGPLASASFWPVISNEDMPSQAFSSDDARNLRRFFIQAAVRYRCSPEWIYRVLVLFLSVNPYEAHNFRAQFSQGKTLDFFAEKCWPAMEGVSENDLGALIRSLIKAQTRDLQVWRTRVLPRRLQTMRDQRKAKLEFRTVYERAYQPMDQAQGDAVEAADRLFIQGQLPAVGQDGLWGNGAWAVTAPPSHVRYDVCLWKRGVSLPTPIELLQPYLSPDDGSMSFGDIRNQIERDFVDTGLLDCTAVQGRTVESGYWRSQELVRANGGQWLTNATATEWLYYSHGTPMRIANLRGPSRFRAILQCFLSRFGEGNLAQAHKMAGLRHMYALGRFLDKARRDPQSAEFRAIQRATGVRNFDEFKTSGDWTAFVIQVIDVSIEEGRCLDGAWQAMQMMLPSIIQPEAPQNVWPLALWIDGCLQDYVDRFLNIFYRTFNVRDTEELTYGRQMLDWKVNPIFGLSAKPKPYYDLPFKEGRDPVRHVLTPFVTGKFTWPQRSGQPPAVERLDYGQEIGSFFLSRGSKTNTTKAKFGQAQFTYISAFSPVSVCYHYAKNLFARCLDLIPTDGQTVSPLQLEACADMMRLLLLSPEIRREYLLHIAPRVLGVVSPEQLALWNPETESTPGKKGVPISLWATVCHLGTFDSLNSRLKFWKVSPVTFSGRVYFYPSFEALKYMAVRLGYARVVDDGGAPTDLQALKYEPPVPDKTPEDENPRLQKPYHHLNVWGKALCPPEGSTKADLIMSKVPMAPAEPAAFDEAFTPQEIEAHGDEVQKQMLAAYRDKLARAAPRARSAEEIREELATVEGDLAEAEENVRVFTNIERYDLPEDWSEDRKSKIWLALNDKGAGLIRERDDLQRRLQRRLQELQRELEKAQAVPQESGAAVLEAMFGREADDVF